MLTLFMPSQTQLTTKTIHMQRPQDILEDEMSIHNQNFLIDNGIDIWCESQLRDLYNLQRVCSRSMRNNFA